MTVEELVKQYPNHEYPPKEFVLLMGLEKRSAGYRRTVWRLVRSGRSAPSPKEVQDTRRRYYGTARHRPRG